MLDDIHELEGIPSLSIVEKHSNEKGICDKKEFSKELILKKRELNWLVRNWKYLTVIFITIGLLGYLIWNSKPMKMWEALANVNFWFILASFFGTLLLFVIKTLRWKIILKHQNVKIPFFDALSLILIGTFGSAVTPAKVGDIFRAFYLTKKQKDVTIGTAVFSVIFDRLLDLTGICLIVGISAPFIFVVISDLEWYIPFGIVIGMILFFIVAFFTFNMKPTKSILNFCIQSLAKIFRKKEAQDKINITTSEILDDFYKCQKGYSLKQYLWLGFLSIIFWIILGLQGMLLLLAFNVTNINFLIVIAILCIGAIAALTLPFSIGGVGIRELIISSLLFKILLVSEVIGVNSSIIQTLLNMILPGIIGGILVVILLRKEKQIQIKE